VFINIETPEPEPDIISNFPSELISSTIIELGRPETVKLVPED
jgi:hypothetical protein